jgi:hypothetical protein
MKKKLLFYGNCHCAFISKWIFEHFSDKFEVLDCLECGVDQFHTSKNFAIWRNNLEKQKSYFECVHKKLQQADFFIFQPIENAAIEELKTEYLIDNIFKGISICLPNSRFTGYPLDQYSLCNYVNYITDNITKDKDKDKIIKYIKNNDNPEFKKILFSNYESCMIENKRRYDQQGNNCTNKIDIYDFIENNWKTNLLFATHNHPAGLYWVELIKILFNHLEEDLDSKKLEVFNYPNKSRILNPMEFLFFRNLFPEIIIPREIEKLYSLEEYMLLEKQGNPAFQLFYF